MGSSRPHACSQSGPVLGTLVRDPPPGVRVPPSPRTRAKRAESEEPGEGREASRPPCVKPRAEVQVREAGNSPVPTPNPEAGVTASLPIGPKGSPRAQPPAPPPPPKKETCPLVLDNAGPPPEPPEAKPRAVSHGPQCQAQGEPARQEGRLEQGDDQSVSGLLWQPPRFNPSDHA